MTTTFSKMKIYLHNVRLSLDAYVLYTFMVINENNNFKTLTSKDDFKHSKKSII